MLLERKRKNKGYISEIIFDASGMSREVMPEVFVHESFGRMTTFFFFFYKNSMGTSILTN
jgi:hypothetical protein